MFPNRGSEALCSDKSSARYDITRRNRGQLDGHHKIDRTDEYTYNKLTMVTIYNAHGYYGLYIFCISW